MLRYHCVKVEELIRKSFLIIPQSLISSKLNSSIFLRSSFLGLSSLLLREKRTDGNTVGYIHSRRTFLLDLFMALWDLSPGTLGRHFSKLAMVPDAFSFIALYISRV